MAITNPWQLFAGLAQMAQPFANKVDPQLGAVTAAAGKAAGLANQLQGQGQVPDNGIGGTGGQAPQQPVQQGQPAQGMQAATGGSDLSGGTAPALNVPTQGQMAEGAIQNGVQPSSFMSRLTGNDLVGEELADWKNRMGIASLLSALGGAVGGNSPIGQLGNALHGIQAGALSGMNAKEAEKSLGGLTQAGVQATMGGQVSPPKSSNYTIGDSSSYGKVTPDDMALVGSALRSGLNWRF